MYMWRELDIVEIRDEMAHIASLGFDVVRIFALTQDFLPAPLTVAADMVARLVEVVRAAKDAGLKVVSTLVVINMSGQFWWPLWMLDADGRPGTCSRIRRFCDHRQCSSRPAPVLCRETSPSAPSTCRTRSTMHNSRARETPAGCGQRSWRTPSGASLPIRRSTSGRTCCRLLPRTTFASMT